jgi:hypothetical protein
MSLSRSVRSVSVLLLVVGVPWAALPQSQQVPSQSADKGKVEAAKLYDDAHPYLDASFPELKRVVRELSGMTPASGQERLPALLAKTGAQADELLHKLPNLISDEGVTTSNYSHEAANGCVGTGCVPPADFATRDETFNYLILTDAAEGGRLSVSEYRTGRNGKPVGQGATGAPSFQGFISAWIILSSANQAE